MSISKKEVLTVASLARLEVDDQRAEELTLELSKILEYVKKLDELDTRDVPATAQVAVLSAPLRPDVRRPSLTREEALSQAPRASEQGFLVPGFVE
jgi:aspartyl-tRNA(Asn)/glutamyl-tRNA(Gln) amidotransferase subunit C